MLNVLTTVNGLDPRGLAGFRELLKAGVNGARVVAKGRSASRTAELVRGLARLREEGEFQGLLWLDFPGRRPRVTGLSGPSVCLPVGAPVSVSDGSVPADLEIAHPGFVTGLAEGCVLLFADGLIQFLVVDVSGRTVRCEVLRGGELTVGRSVAYQGWPADDFFHLSQEEVETARALRDVDDLGVVLSWVSEPEQMRHAMSQLGDHLLIPKLESEIPLSRLDGILGLTSQILVGRSDLMSAVGPEHLPLTVAHYLRRAVKCGVEPHVGSLVLDSLEHRSTPTPSDVDDVCRLLAHGVTTFLLGGTSSTEAMARKARAMTQIYRHGKQALSDGRPGNGADCCS